MSGCSRRPNPAGASTAGAERAAPPKSRPQPHRPDGQCRVTRRRPQGRSEAATSTSPISPSPRSTSTTVVASVFEPPARRVADANHVAADIAREEIVEEHRDEDTSRAAIGVDLHVLRAEQHVPTPRARHDVDGVDHERGEEPRQRRRRGDRPQLADIDPREENPEKHDADGELDDDEGVATPSDADSGSEDIGGDGTALYYDFMRKSLEPCAF